VDFIFSICSCPTDCIDAAISFAGVLHTNQLVKATVEFVAVIDARKPRLSIEVKQGSTPPRR
jgi:hypothetical protein